MANGGRFSDSQGFPLRVGQKVAYNLSGDVVPGEIVRVGDTGIIKIMYEGEDAHLYLNPKFSRVRNSDSILVLR